PLVLALPPPAAAIVPRRQRLRRGGFGLGGPGPTIAATALGCLLLGARAVRLSAARTPFLAALDPLDLEARDLAADQLLDGGDVFAVGGGGERERAARHAGAAGAADAVDVILGVQRHVEQKDVAEPRDVEAPGRHVAAH